METLPYKSVVISNNNKISILNVEKSFEEIDYVVLMDDFHINSTRRTCQIGITFFIRKKQQNLRWSMKSESFTTTENALDHREIETNNDYLSQKQPDDEFKQISFLFKPNKATASKSRLKLPNI